MHVVCIDSISGGDEIDHGGLGEEVAITLNGVAVHERVGRERARVDVGDDEGLGGGRSLGHRRDGKKRGENEGCSHENLSGDAN